MLERYVQVGQDFPLAHQRYDRVHMGVGVDVVHAHPDAELAQAARQILERRRPVLAAPFALRIAQVEPVGRGVLRHDQQLFHARPGQDFRLAQHVGDRP